LEGVLRICFWYGAQTSFSAIELNDRGFSGIYMTTRIHWVSLLIFIAVCLGAGALGSITTTAEIKGWYKTIEKPLWNPPDYVFGPVWTTLYVMMGVAAWFVWKSGSANSAILPLVIFGIQLILNVAWSWIFFGMHEIGWAFVEIVVLWLAIAATTAVFFHRSQIAGLLMVPYLLWVSFASILNFAIWQLNAS
jgi:translocator protein